MFLIQCHLVVNIFKYEILHTIMINDNDDILLYLIHNHLSDRKKFMLFYFFISLTSLLMQFYVLSTIFQ
jgi:hypothetical protein